MNEFETLFVKNIIKNATGSEITQIILAIQARYHRLYPQEEVVFLSLPLEPDRREQILQGALGLLRKTGDPEKSV